MTAQLQIDQDGLPPGVPGKARTDGLATGAPVTLTNTGTSGSTTEFRLLWAPPGDATAGETLAATGDPNAWTFTPTAGKYGSYVVALVEDGLLIERRVFAVRTPNLGLIIPALGEIGGTAAGFVHAGGAELVDDNATDFADPDLNAMPFAAWWRAMHELILRVDAGGGSGPPWVPPSPLPSIPNLEGTQNQLNAVIDALVELGLITDDR